MPDLSTFNLSESVIYEFSKYPYLTAFNYVLEHEELSFERIQEITCKLPDIRQLNKLLSIISEFVSKHKSVLMSIKNSTTWKEIFSDSIGKQFHIPFLNDCIKLGKDLGYDTQFNDLNNVIITQTTDKCYNWYDDKIDFQSLEKHGIKNLKDLRNFIEKLHHINSEKWADIASVLFCSPTILLDPESKTLPMNDNEPDPLSQLNYLRVKTYLQFMYSHDIFHYLWDMLYFSPLKLCQQIFDILTQKRIGYSCTAAQTISKFTYTLATDVKTILSDIASTTSKDTLDVQVLVNNSRELSSENFFYGLNDWRLSINDRTQIANKVHKIFKALMEEKEYTDLLSTFIRLKDTGYKAFIKNDQEWCYLYEFKLRDINKIIKEDNEAKILGKLDIMIKNLNKLFYQETENKDYFLQLEYNNNEKEKIGHICLKTTVETDKSKVVIHTENNQVNMDPMYLTPEYFLNKVITKLSMGDFKDPSIDSNSIDRKKVIDEAYAAFKELSKNRRWTNLFSVFKKIKDPSQDKFLKNKDDECNIYEFKGIDVLRVTKEKTMDDFINNIANKLLDIFDKIFASKFNGKYFISYEILDNPKETNVWFVSQILTAKKKKP
jgi:hypothetical protein